MTGLSQVRLQIVTLPGGQSRIVAERLQELRNALRNGGSSTEDTLLFAEALYGRAPDDFLKRCHQETLVDIASDASSAVGRYLAKSSPAVVEVKNSERDTERGTYTSVFTVSLDRPFIIDSIVETFRELGIKHHVLLHPIFKTQSGSFLSVAYIEIDRIESANERDHLKKRLDYCLSNVARVTNDFEAIVSKARLARDWMKLLPPDPLEEDEERAEVGDFLQWMIDERFLFLGYREWHTKNGKLLKQDVDLGLFHSEDRELVSSLEEVIQDAEYLSQSDGYFQFSKLHTLSPVHRRGKIDLVTVRTTMNGEVVTQCFIGQLTSRAIAQEATTIPVIRKKISSLLKQEGFIPNSHDYKELVSLIGTLPKGDLLQLDRETVRQDLQVMMGIQRRNETKVILREHSLKRFFAISIFMPRDRFSSGAIQRIQRYLKRTFVQYDPSSRYYVSGTEDQLVALYFLIPKRSEDTFPIAGEEIERSIAELSLSWEEKLEVLLSREHGRERGLQLSSLYNEVFPDSYKAGTSHRETLVDIQFLEYLSDDAPLVLDLRPNPKVDGEYLLKIYKRGESLSLSELLPYLENVGFHVQHETVTKLSQLAETTWGAIHTLAVRPRGAQTKLEELENLLPGMKALISGEAENDRLNGLLLGSGVNIREIALLRTMGHYLWQLKEVPSGSTFESALLSSPHLARLAVQAFDVRFSTREESVATRHAKFSALRDQYLAELSKVSSLAYDRALRALFNLIESVVRTNFYKTSDLRISLKIECAKISRMPEPRPLFEIFVCAPTFEGVHLRGGKVARGGIRWSERPDDFRTEVFGLMKTQMMKNAIIVPVGAKGGFIVKGVEKPSRELVVECYKSYIRSLLEITDNLVNNAVVPPRDVLRYDADDPYLVVAADKGTASFSDIANEIAVSEYKFWLGDAFASGGSRGYNHKSFGITARGAWETTKRHFRERQMDIVHEPFSIVGIGDMSGDVFGNGLLLSPQAKLLAAFDHRHIFIDPNPDPKVSYAERKRLFELPTSSWKDYNAALISSGGGVYDRALKEIRLSDEARAALGTSEEVVSGVELIRIILKAPVDLLWNGGIGTYVKASYEHNVQVGDRTNDDVRISASELRAKIVAEGGNLGFTQAARVEFAAGGGSINTDAVDNSGGVNLSDLEVNIKILLSLAVAKGKLTMDARNTLLAEIADEVCDFVLRRNARQAEAISAGGIRSKTNLTYFRGLLAQYEKERLLDRNQDVMPDDETLFERSKTKLGILRPELAILLACNKMRITEIVLNSSIPEDPAMERYLFEYFPQKLRTTYREEILAHPLRREIIASQVSNILGERLGVTFLYRVVEELGASEEAIITAFLAGEFLLEADALAAKLSEFDTPSSARKYLSAMNRLNTALDNVTRWILQGGIAGTKFGAISEVKRKFGVRYRDFEQKSFTTLPPEERRFSQELISQFTDAGFPENLAHQVAALQFATANLDLCELSERHSVPTEFLLQLYSEVAQELQVRHLLELVSKVDVHEHWDITAQRTLGSAIRSTPGYVVQDILELPGDSAEEKLRQFRTKYEKGLKHYLAHLRDVEGKPLSISALLVLSNQLSGFWKEA